jgi:hypothetical protein
MARQNSSSNAVFGQTHTHPPTVQPCDGDVTHDGKARPGSAAGTPVIVRTRVPALYVAAR